MKYYTGDLVVTCEYSWAAAAAASVNSTTRRPDCGLNCGQCDENKK